MNFLTYCLVGLWRATRTTSSTYSYQSKLYLIETSEHHQRVFIFVRARPSTMDRQVSKQLRMGKVISHADKRQTIARSLSIYAQLG